MTQNDILALVTKLILAGGGGAVIAYGLFKHLGGKWIDDRFAAKQAALNAGFNERLQDLKAQQDQSLRYIQSEIDRNIHRAKKLYDREFDVISEAWELLDKVYRIADVTATDKLDLDDPDQNEEWQKRQEAYFRFSGELDILIARSGIFMPNGIWEDFARLSVMLRTTFVAITMDVYDKHATVQIIKNFKENGEPILMHLRGLIRDRFWSAGGEHKAGEWSH